MHTCMYVHLDSLYGQDLHFTNTVIIIITNNNNTNATQSLSAAFIFIIILLVLIFLRTGQTKQQQVPYLFPGYMLLLISKITEITG